MISILTSSNPVEYTLFSIFNDIDKFRIFIQKLCDKKWEISDDEISLILNIVNQNRNGWTLRKC